MSDPIEVKSMSVRQMKKYLVSKGVSLFGILTKSELIKKVKEVCVCMYVVIMCI